MGVTVTDGDADGDADEVLGLGDADGETLGGRSGRSVFRGRLQDDVEIREAERSGEAVLGRLFGVIDGREPLD